MDISNAILAKSDQINAVDLVGGARTVKITDTWEGTAEQRVVVVTDYFGPERPFKPSKTVLRVLGEAWGRETDLWVGRRMELYRDPSVRWAGEEVGGIRISALSHIDKPMKFVLPTSKGKTAKSTVAVLPAEAPRAWLAEAKTITDYATLNRLGHAAHKAGVDDETMGKLRVMLAALKPVAPVDDAA